MTGVEWPTHAATIIAWALGAPVNLDALVVDLEWWSNHFAASAALWPDATAQRGDVRTADELAVNPRRA